MDDLPDAIKDWIGRVTVVVDHVVTVEQGLWTNFCVAIEDGNLLYWDYPASRDHTETVIAPPAMLPSWAIEHAWTPGRDRPTMRTLELHFMVKDALGLRNGIVTEVELEFHAPLRAGESVRAEQILRSVSEERETRLGIGRNWEIDVVYRKPDGSLAGIQHLHFLAYGKLDS
ncbi:MaoC family dehydratase N-terminal domain-containing protein [Sphingosinicella sp.]|jgi:hypothetical protein|uniref:FAS1-like dehydratase domain-containing protein n=1 Tax=Sphingosinicella sp. TaxID=1917971 RepID=UPI0017E30E62|nr:MaoC family dehydratase N-terminal domain-containing protein [Sphingosinicella sp.]MBA4759935.1 MaoC family dehydratase N-terminal domain-containing protein [Sphingosinicella sp.]